MMSKLFQWFAPVEKEPTEYQVNSEFQFVNLPEHIDNIFSIQIIKGKFKGLCIAVTDFVQLDTSGKMTYNYTLVRGKLKKRQEQQFEKIANEVVVNAIHYAQRNQAAFYDEVLKDNGEDGHDYTEEYTEQRTVLPKSSSVS